MSTFPNDDNIAGWLEPQSPVVLSKSLEEALETREKLYRAVLADQDRLQSQEHVSQTQIQPIRQFYDQRLQDVLGELSNLRDQRELNKIIEWVVSVAQSGNLEQARLRLTRELKHWPDQAQLKELYEEIDGRYRQIQAALKAKSQAQDLVASAKAFIQKQDYEAARKFLQSARELQPDDGAIEECFQQTEELLRQERENEQLADGQLADGQASSLGVVGATEVEEPITASLVPSMPIVVGSSSTTSSQATLTGNATPKPSPSTTWELRAAPSFADDEEVPNVAQRHLEALSTWTNLVKPFLMDNVGWFVGAFLVIAGFVVLIVTFWNTIEQNQILMHSLVFVALFLATSLFFVAAYFMRLKYPQLESSSDVLLVIVALLIPLVFAAAILTALIPATQAGDSLVQVGQAVE